MADRWWKNERSVAAARVRSTRKRMRAAYRRSVAVAIERAEKDADARVAIEKRKLGEYAAEVRRDNERLAAEVARATLRFQPDDFGSRWTLYVTFSESFMASAHGLKDVGPYVVEHLTAMISRELAMVDFSRAKPVAFTLKQRSRGSFPVFEWDMDPSRTVEVPRG